MASLGPVEGAVIAGELERCAQHCIRREPTAEEGIPCVVIAVLKEYAQRLRLVLAYDGLQAISSAHGHKGAAPRENAPE